MGAGDAQPPFGLTVEDPCEILPRPVGEKFARPSATGRDRADLEAVLVSGEFQKRGLRSAILHAQQDAAVLRHGERFGRDGAVFDLERNRDGRRLGRFRARGGFPPGQEAAERYEKEAHRDRPDEKE